MDRTEIVPVVLPDGTEILVRASLDGGQEEIAAFGRRISFASAAATIEGVARALNGTLRKIQPTRASIEFGIEFTVESGQLSAVLVQGSGTASLAITLQWDGPAPPSGPV